MSAASQSSSVARVAHQHHAPAKIAEHGNGLRANFLVGTDPRFERQLLRLEGGVEIRSAIDANSRARAVEVHRTRTTARWKRRHRRGSWGGSWKRLLQGLRCVAPPREKFGIARHDLTVEPVRAEVSQGAAVLERRVKLIVGDDVVAIVVIEPRERAVHEELDVFAAQDGVVDAKLIHVAHERRTTRAIDPVTDAKILFTTVAERDIPRVRFANQLSVDVKLHSLQEHVDGDRDVVPTTIGDGDFRRWGVRAHVRRVRGRFREKPERPVDVVAAAQMTVSAAQQVH